MNSLSPRLSRVAQSAVQSVTMSQISQMLDQTRTSRASHSLFPVCGPAPMQHSLFPSIDRHQVRTQHTTPTARQRMPYQLDREIQKQCFDYGGLKGESHQIRSSSEANLLVGIIGRVLGLISDESDSETHENEVLPLPGFLGKSVVEAGNAVATNHEEEKEIRGTRRNRVAIYSTRKPSSKRFAKKATSPTVGNRYWVPGLETMMFIYPRVL
ncbi:hypothetical protein FPSE_04189 [Fusarium pseudograminearum CS3096]|uniref:Uncharacterized protein n=1 Tax=Fusarium pseudograminearum (strain CS3096) TaxID=1028729 RepID=K3VPG3_FUSPC|nr:hypothetical protein FPSE_04189 [Fusarium pseudograminearum CS3096]EKJ75688.1 hypothetical protein FPSE_04189 [Fusarium pseudograminearum CS3096]